jgi:hypothetical protein
MPGTSCASRRLKIHSLVKTKTPKTEAHRFGARIDRHCRRLFVVVRAYLDGLDAGRFVVRPGLGSVTCDDHDNGGRSWGGGGVAIAPGYVASSRTESFCHDEFVFEASSVERAQSDRRIAMRYRRRTRTGNICSGGLRHASRPVDRATAEDTIVTQCCIKADEAAIQAMKNLGQHGPTALDCPGRIAARRFVDARQTPAPVRFRRPHRTLRREPSLARCCCRAECCV